MGVRSIRQLGLGTVKVKPVLFHNCLFQKELQNTKDIARHEICRTGPLNNAVWLRVR